MPRKSGKLKISDTAFLRINNLKNFNIQKTRQKYKNYRTILQKSLKKEKELRQL